MACWRQVSIGCLSNPNLCLPRYDIYAERHRLKQRSKAQIVICGAGWGILPTALLKGGKMREPCRHTGCKFIKKKKGKHYCGKRNPERDGEDCYSFEPAQNKEEKKNEKEIH